MSTPAVILPAIQRGDMDCGLCCLQMLADRPYDVVRDEALKAIPKLHEGGMYAAELIRVGRKLGLRFVKRAAWDDEAVGVLDIRLPSRKRHFAVWFYGVLLNPADGMAWEPSVYQATRQAKYVALYAVAEHD